MPDRQIAGLGPPIGPFDRRRTRWAGIAPLEAKKLGERLDREIARRPLGLRLHDIVRKIDGARGIERSLDVSLGADAGVFLLEPPPNRAPRE
jgi:hypothetical protein